MSQSSKKSVKYIKHVNPLQARLEQAVSDAFIRQSRFLEPYPTKKRKKTARYTQSQQLDIIKSIRKISDMAVKRTVEEIKQERIAKTLYPSPSPVWGRSVLTAPPLTREQARDLCNNTMEYLHIIGAVIETKPIRKHLEDFKQGRCFFQMGTPRLISILAWSLFRYNVFPSLGLSDFDFYIDNVTPDLVSQRTLLETVPDIPKTAKDRIALSQHYIYVLQNQIDDLLRENKIGEADSLKKLMNIEKKKIANIFDTLKSSYKFDKIAIIQTSVYFSSLDSYHSMLFIINPFIKRYILMDSNGMEPLEKYQKSLLNYIKNGITAVGLPDWEFKFYPRVQMQYESASCAMWAFWMGVVYLLGSYRECFYVKHKLDEQVMEFTKNIASTLLYCLPISRNISPNELCELITECDSNLFINWDTLKPC